MLSDIFQAYKQFGSRVKGVKRKLEDITPNLPKTRNLSQIHSPSIEAPSPTSSTGSDLELPDAFIPPGKVTETYQRPQHSQPSVGMDLDSRITSFLAAGSQAIAVSNI